MVGGSFRNFGEKHTHTHTHTPHHTIPYLATPYHTPHYILLDPPPHHLHLSPEKQTQNLNFYKKYEAKKDFERKWWYNQSTSFFKWPITEVLENIDFPLVEFVQ